MAQHNKDPGPGILIIEDEALVARDIESRLRQLGHRVVGVAHNPRQAIEKAEQERPDLLLCDIHLKDKIDGIDVARAITDKLQIPVIFLTAYSDRETVRRAKALGPYGYVLKPVEMPDLQIAIEMAMHKFGIEQELRETRELLATALQCIGDALVFIDNTGKVSNINTEAASLLGISEAAARGLDWKKLLGPDDHQGENSSIALLRRAMNADAVSRLPPLTLLRRDGSQVLVDGIIGRTTSKGEGNGVVCIFRELVKITDPLENLPRPSDLAQAFEDFSSFPTDSERAFVLLLISPDDHNGGLQSVEPEQQQALLEEIGTQLNRAMRNSDLATYYGGATFSASLPNTSLEEAGSIAGAILRKLSEYPLMNGRLSLSFSIGIAHYQPGLSNSNTESPLELFRRANRALTLARQSGGGRVAIWRPGSDIDTIGNLDSQSGLLAADSGQDYRNMVLLWNTMNSVASARDIRALAGTVVARFRKSFNLAAAALYSSVDNKLQLLSRDPSPEQADNGENLIPVEVLQVTENPTGKRDVLHSVAPEGVSTYCFPVSHGGTTLGALHLVLGDGQASLRQQDLSFLKTLVDYIAGPLSRQLSPAASRDEKVHADAGPELLYQSETMRAVMELLRLVAPTDETVLITGESGTGKELIARDIHRLSTRSSRPFVIVDCGAVVSSLIESELFGHIKGAFTGATSTTPGKLLEADGGTILLDEVGELPLEVQVKLLRVVQEKQFTAVGSNKVQTVNTRIIAATNQDLEANIRAGTFREDLYYRLNVINVHTPPLRDRQGDILFLANHFLRACSRQYHKDIEGFSPAALRALQTHRWPGNIRELRNTLIRAVILCQGRWVDLVHLELRDDGDRVEAGVRPVARPSSSPPAPAEMATATIAQLEDILRRLFADQVRECLVRGVLPPLGDWLEQELILAGLQRCNNVNLQAADMLGIPESTLRRKLGRFSAARREVRLESNRYWQSVVRLLPDWIEQAREDQINPLQHLYQLLLAEISLQCRTQAQGAALIGVSPPTYRRQVSQLAV